MMNNALELGQHIKGTDDDGNLLNYNLLGKEEWVTFGDFFSGAARGRVQARLANTPVCVRIVRNVSGGVLTASRVCQFDLTTAVSEDATSLTPVSSGTNFIPMIKTVAKESDGDDLLHCAIVDPSLSATVPDDALCYVVVEGPCLVRLKATTDVLSIAEALSSAASGRIGEAGASLDMVIGYALQARATTANDGGLVLMHKVRGHGQF